MDSIYRALAKEGGAVPSFDACVEQFSDEKKAFWVGWLQMPVEFEDIVFGLNAGEISRPFLTPQGIHIVKVLEQQEILPFERMKDKIIRCQTRRHGMDKGTRAFVDKLKKEYHYMPDKAGIDELLVKEALPVYCLHWMARHTVEKSLPDLPLFIRQGRTDSWRLLQ